MNWEQIKLICSIIYSQYVGSGKIIDDSNGDTTTPASLAIMMDLVSNSLAGYPLDFDFAQETGTITLNGSTYYDLTTLFPGIKSVYQIYREKQFSFIRSLQSLGRNYIFSKISGGGF